jgi:hypothetical protein
MNQPSYYSKFQTVANNVMHVDTVVFRGEAVLMMPEAIRPETLLVDAKILIITSWM